MLRFPIIACVVIAFSASAFADRQFLHPDRIRYDGQCLTIDGKDTFIFSGAFHYFRCPKELWRDRFAKIKAAGCNAVETYVAWNVHEPQMPAGLDDFSRVDLADLRDWLKMAHDEFGLYTIVRPGPYICAEWANGGFPIWLALKRPESVPADRWARSDDPTFLAWSKHWFDAVCPVIASEQITRKEKGKPGVILFQLENEYDYASHFADAQRAAHVKALAQYAAANGIDVPLFTCWTKQIRGNTDPVLRNVFDATNYYPRWNLEQVGKGLAKCAREQPDAPLLISELQGGWFSGVGGKLSEEQDGVTAEQCNGVTLMAIAHGATLLNYYMFFGGTNFGDWGARGMTTTYDYAAPIREHGGVDDKYRAVQAIGKMLQQHGPALARSREPRISMGRSDVDVLITARQSADGQTFIFLWNKARSPQKDLRLSLVTDKGAFQVQCDLAPRESKMLHLPAGEHDSSRGTWYPQLADPIVRPSPPAHAKIVSIVHRAEPLPTDWKPVKPADSLQSLGIFDSRYGMYRSVFKLDAQQARNLDVLELKLHSGDAVAVQLNGQLLPSATNDREFFIPTKAALREGENDLHILYENAGYANFGDTICQLSGLESASLASGASDVAVTDWRVKVLDADNPGDQIKPDFDDSSWESFVLNDKTIADVERGRPTKAQQYLCTHDGSRAVFRAAFDVNEKVLEGGKTRIRFGRIDDQGTIYVNGQRVGDWESWDEPCELDSSKFVRAGRNVVAVVVKNDNGPGGLTRPVRVYSAGKDEASLPLEIATKIDGSGEWSQSTPPSGALLVSHRVTFELPEVPKNLWVPWKAHIEATGNGMLYLNGHPLGRHWEVGPQRDFYLPECWLNFGAGKTNTLTMMMRPLDQGTELKSIEVLPYENAAELR